MTPPGEQAVPAPLTADQIRPLLAALGRDVVLDEGTSAEAGAARLAHVLVAAAERNAIAAESTMREAAALAVASGGAATETLTATEQAAYDLTTARGALELLGLLQWRASRQVTGIEALREVFTAGSDTAGPEEGGTGVDGFDALWEMAVTGTAGTAGVLAVLADAATSQPPAHVVSTLDAATDALGRAGGQAVQMRRTIGLD